MLAIIIEQREKQRVYLAYDREEEGVVAAARVNCQSVFVRCGLCCRLQLKLTVTCQTGSWVSQSELW